MDTTKLETPYFIPYYLLVFAAIIVFTTMTFQSKEKAGNNKTEVAKKEKKKIDPTVIKPEVGYLAPNFTLPTTNGDSVTLSSLKGNVIFLNFWATWCKPCRDEMPSMQELWDKFKTTKFVMLAVSVDKDKGKYVLPFLEQYKINFPVLYDPEGITSKLYQTTGVPETFIIDKSGRIIYKGVGPQNWSEPEALEAFDFIIKGPKNHPPIKDAVK